MTRSRTPWLSSFGLLTALGAAACNPSAPEAKEPAPSKTPQSPALEAADGEGIGRAAPSDDGAAPTPPPASPEAAVGAAPASDPDAAPKPAPPGAGTVNVSAVVKIDAKPGGKKFQGVWLHTDSGRRLVVSYRAHEHWRAFEGRRVEAQGKHYQPEGQAIMADHFRVTSIVVPDPTPDDEIVWMSAEEDYEGEFQRYEWPKGSKGAGGNSTVFRSDDGRRFWLHHVPDPLPPMGTPVKVRGIEYGPSNFAARPGGSYLWVLKVRATK